MSRRLFSPAQFGSNLLRIALCAIVFTHGIYRYHEGTLPVLGRLLEESGFPHGTGYFLACCVNLAETIGASLLALGILVWPLCLVLSLIYFTGIVIFHWQAGFFVVGPGTGGWEYSALLITCLVTVAWDNRNNRWWPFVANGRHGEFMGHSSKVKQKRIVMIALVVSITTTFTGVLVQTAQAEQSIPAYAGALRRAVVFENDPGSNLSLTERMERWKVPGISVSIIDNCKIVDRHGFGITRRGGVEVQSDTLFQAASVTKPVAAFAALRLVDQGLLSLDSDVNGELRSWKVPASPLLEGHPVTLRGILSHSAGLIPGGYGGYSHGESVPTLIQTLNGVGPARPKSVRVAYEPGSDWRYSGGGYLVAQLLMTEKTGKSFETIVRDEVLIPAGMISSTFAEPSASQNVASGHVADGTMVPGGWHVYPELAAASLWTTAPDLANFGLAALKAVREEPDAQLSPVLASQMASAHVGPRSLGFVVGGKGKARHFGHDGTNEGYNSSLILYPETCQGAAIMANSDNAKPLIAELLRSIADTYHWPDSMPSVVMKRKAHNPVVAARFKGTYTFTDIPGVAPFSIISAKDGSLTFDRGDGHSEPLYASSDGLIGPDSGIIIKANSPANGAAETITYSRIGGHGTAEAKRVKPKP